ncbi:MAG TPA: RDD family protein [Candidatus Acidoferrum sp.]|nr:RDD family protein [Candidatus Acidoferrum sp.]
MFCSKCGANVPDNATFCSACGQATGGIPVAAPAAVAARPGVQYAGFWLRFVAWIIDRIVLQIASWILFLPFMASLGFQGLFRGEPPRPEEILRLAGSIFRLALIALVVNWLYYSLLESSAWQGTLGKKALGLEVTDLAGHRVSFARATGRFFGRIISGLILGIGFIMAGFTERKQALHDMLASCLVIRKV